MKSERTTGSFIPVNLRNPAVFIALRVSFFECIGFARPCDILNHAALGAGRNGSAARNTNKDRRQKADCEYDPHVATFLSLNDNIPRARETLRVIRAARPKGLAGAGPVSRFPEPVSVRSMANAHGKRKFTPGDGRANALETCLESGFGDRPLPMPRAKSPNCGTNCATAEMRPYAEAGWWWTQSQ